MMNKKVTKYFDRQRILRQSSEQINAEAVDECLYQVFRSMT
jgi:hypothetical protein